MKSLFNRNRDVIDKDGIIVGKLQWHSPGPKINPGNSYWSFGIVGCSKLNFSILEDAVKYAKNLGYRVIE